MLDSEFALAESTCRDEGVTATQSGTGIRLSLPRPVSVNHQICIVAILWEVWKAAQNDACGEKSDWIVDTSAMTELPLPLVAILSVIDADLNQVSRNLFIVYASGRPSTEVE
ncbi:MAG: hypothetical protein WC655_20605 [Candidatus Hydrogenedentales bacterium]|jgi:hypothetical protein